MAAAAPGVGGGLGAWGGLRFIRWAIEFAYKRRDAREARLDQKERDLEERFNARLRHLEYEVDRYRKATMLLVNRMASRNPEDPVLQEVAEILRASVPMAPADADLDELARRAGEALDGR